jgi:hypothetical protein
MLSPVRFTIGVNFQRKIDFLVQVNFRPFKMAKTVAVLFVVVACLALVAPGGALPFLLIFSSVVTQ